MDKAKTDAENVLRAAQLESKEKALQQKQQHESDLAKAREQIRARELSLDRKEETLQQAADDVRKQEKMVEANQRPRGREGPRGHSSQRRVAEEPCKNNRPSCNA